VYHAWRYTVWSDSVEQVRREAEAEAAARDSAAAAQAAEEAAVEEEVAEVEVVEEEAAEQEPPAVEVTPPPAEEEEEAEEPAMLPDMRLYVIAAAPVPPGSYLVRVYRLVNLSGLEADSEATFEVPEPEPPPEPGEEEEPPDTAGAEGSGR
jgi:hypothetical protein